MIFLKLITDLCCGACDALGGWHILWMRRYLMPALIGITCAIVTHTWWVVFLPLPCMGTLCIGYSKDGNLGRALWIGLQCLVLGLGLCIFGHLIWYFYLPYIIGGCVLGGLYRNWEQILGDIVTGCWLGLIVLIIH